MKSMHNVGKFITMLAVVILILGIYINYSGLSRRISQSTSRPSPSAQASSPFSGTDKSSPVFDLDGPLVCDYVGDQAKITARILSKNIYMKYEKEETPASYILVKDGVLYTWTHGSYEGQKIPEVGQYLSLFDTFSMFMSPDMLFSLIPQVDGTKISSETTAGLKESCIKKNVNEEVFTVPKAVTFTETDLKQMKVPEEYMQK